MSGFSKRLKRLSDVQRKELAERLKVLEDKKTKGKLVAFIVSRGGFSETNIRLNLAKTLPVYMLPQRIVRLEYMPLNSNGKIDRSRLQLPDKKINLPLSSQVEKSLFSIWCEVLEMDNIQADDDYFELGGDSITSMQIVARAAKLGLKFSPNELLENPTISQLTALINCRKIESNTSIATDDDPSTTVTSEDDMDEMLRVMSLDE